MSEQRDDFDQESQRRSYTKPHSGKHPIPTIQGYREHRRHLQDQAQQTQEAQEGPEDQSKTKRAFNSAKRIFKGEDEAQNRHEPYPAANRHYLVRPDQDPRQLQNQDQSQVPGYQGHGDSGVEGLEGEGQSDANKRADLGGPNAVDDALEQNTQQEQQQQEQPGQQQQQQGQQDDKGRNAQEKSATEHVASMQDPKAKRKVMKKASRQTGGREVTDPVTHLPLVIHDQTDKDLKSAPQNEPEPGEHHTTATGPQGASKTPEQLKEEQAMLQRGFNGIQRLFPGPESETLKKRLAETYERTLAIGLAVISVAAAGPFVASSWLSQDGWIPPLSTIIGITILIAIAFVTVWGLSHWLSKKVTDIFEDETWDASRREEKAILDSDTELPESVQWLNSFLASIWPLINPDLFSSLIDEIEDIMQASLPKVVKMVSIDDMGQGNQSLRILGVRWLPSGAASQSVGPGGQLERPDKTGQHSDRTDPENAQAHGTEEDREKNLENGGANEEDDDKKGGQTKQDEQTQIAIREGMEAEEGDFVNLELALAYRSRTSSKSIREKSKNAHLYLKFYTVGGVAVPVWVELRGFIATLRVRMQLTPDPPFVSLCTLTFLGQPKASMACVPLSRHAPNLMDVPMISSFVQSAIDAALAEYVAPKSLTLNLKDMLMGEDFKKDTISRGIVLIYIKAAHGIKQGDAGIGPRQGSSDAYCTVSWGKFGKTVCSTRIITGSQDPEWHEYASILVTSEELNAEERLRLQIWDSDKWTADDDLGRVEVDLKELMHNPDTQNKMKDREDRFTGQDPEERMPGSLEWSVGYFSKVKITEQQLQKQTVNRDIRTRDQLRQHISDMTANKLREAGKSDDDDELHQQRAQDYAEMEGNMIASAPPSQEYVSGILSVQIHNITSLEIQKLQKPNKDGDESDADSEAETGDDMPDSYCTIILNHKKIYRTRTKPKNSKPFFNAGTERFIRDWRTTDIIIAVRDARSREDDPLIGIVFLPLNKVFAEKSQVVDVYPLVGGIGYGRVRVSMVWRSVQLKLPRNFLGWDYGTLEVRGSVRVKTSSSLPETLLGSKIKLHTDLGKIKVYSNGDSTWSLGKRDDRSDESAFLPVRKRYASPLVLEFRESTLGTHKTSAFAVFWLQELVDEEAETRTLSVWQGSSERLARARENCDYNGLDEGEQPLGEVELDLKFWRGLSGYHKRFASNSRTGNMRDVMECLDTITDENLTEGEYEDEDDDDSSDEGESKNGESANVIRRGSGDKEAKKKLKVHTNDDSSDGEYSSNDEANGTGKGRSSLSLNTFKKLGKAPKKILHNPVDGTLSAALDLVAPGHNDEDDGSRGVWNSLRDYKDHHKELHRKHRGIMQWRAAREINHVAGKLNNLKGDVSGLFHHGDKDVGAETEV